MKVDIAILYLSHDNHKNKFGFVHFIQPLLKIVCDINVFLSIICFGPIAKNFLIKVKKVSTILNIIVIIDIAFSQ